MTVKHTRKRQFSREKVVKFILAFVLLWFVTSLIISAVTGMMIKTAIIGKARVEKLYTPLAMVTCTAYKMESPFNGQGAAIIQEGEKVRKNEAVYRVSAPDGTALQGEKEKIMYAPVAGIVSYHIDGYEDIKGIEDVKALDFAAIYKAQKEETRDNQASLGQAFAKIINNLNDIFIYFDCEKNSYTETFEEDMKLRIRFPQIGYSTLCRIVEIEPWQSDEEERLWVKADLGTAEQQVLGQRIWQVELPYDVAQVIEIDKQAVVYRNGVPGVYALDKGFAYWQEITISEEREDAYVVKDIAEGTEIVTTPKLVSEGERVKVK